MNTIVVAALYRFAKFPDFESFRTPLHQKMLELEIKGTLLIAPEGINGTVAGLRSKIDALLAWLENDERFANLVVKESLVDENPFYRCKVKLKKEIVTMGVEDIDPNHIVGTYVKPKDWNALISDPEVLVVDTRNKYEYEIGTFKNALDPKTDTFREFPSYVKETLDKNIHKKVAMFCTGGIRCEKSTAYLKQQGFDEVYHLEGGILQYLEDVPKQESLWEGECFVFDNRVTVNHDLEKGDYDQCHACRMPITDADKNREEYLKGVSCHYCIDNHSDEQRQRYSERENQMNLAKQRGETHIGSSMEQTIKQRKKEKLDFKKSQREGDTS
ncbi:MAG: hypothetical protein COC19_04050 [SAR86 cluster bacterium]|uniref:tRNA uridine(34) hydroxylase n=1 Tax=SAR86 cluster bacterium TaxID=2030880 RepID=A0A2A4MP15_9GAMM|nr:MAG: hypothetical protein COC19_04050 [SAR86 cluster bacterium]